MYLDGRPEATLRMEAKDQGIILRHGDIYGSPDLIGAREALIFKEHDVYHLFYDGMRPGHPGCCICLATSRDLVRWEKHGQVLENGQPGELDSSNGSPWVYHENGIWHMFNVGSPNGLHFPYLTFKAKSASLAGPWTRQKEPVLQPRANTYYSITASAGCVVKHDGEYLQFFSSTTMKEGQACVLRTLGIARTQDLDGAWSIDPAPILPIQEQVENSFLYYEPACSTWFLFTNHIGYYEYGGEYTDAIWVYWTRDLNKWNPEHKAVVLDGSNCTWSKRCIGMPSVIPVGNRLAVFYDAPGGDSVNHYCRHIGLAWLDLPLSLPGKGNRAEFLRAGSVGA